MNGYSRGKIGVDNAYDARKILVLLPNWLGDVAMCTLALRTLYKRFPHADVTLAGRSAAYQLLDGLPWTHRTLILPPQPSLSDIVRIGRELRPWARDLAVVFPHSFRAALLAWAAGSRRRLGYARGHRSLLLTDRVAPYRENGRVTPVYMAKEYLDLLRSLGCEDDGQGLELWANPRLVEEIRRQFPEGGPRIGIAPGGAFGPSKRWPTERFAQVADMLHERIGARCMLLTGPGEETLRDAVMGSAKTPLLLPETTANSIETLKAVIAQLDLLIGNDSGPRHVAVAFGVPVICIMGPTSPRYSEGPYERGRVLRVDVDCGPCQKPVCATDHCCMTHIGVNHVVAAALAHLPAKKN